MISAEACRKPTEQDPMGSLLVAEYESLLRYSQRLTSNGTEARDLVQMACVRALSVQLDPGQLGNGTAWLRTIVFRLFVDLRRRARREIPTDSELLLSVPNTTEPEPGLSRISMQQVYLLIACLPSHYRVPYELYTFEHMPYRRIADVLGLPCKTVASRISRARRELRALLDEPITFDPARGRAKECLHEPRRF